MCFYKAESLSSFQCPNCKPLTQYLPHSIQVTVISGSIYQSLYSLPKVGFRFQTSLLPVKQQNTLHSIIRMFFKKNKHGILRKKATHPRSSLFRQNVFVCLHWKQSFSKSIIHSFIQPFICSTFDHCKLCQVWCKVIET